MKKIKHILAIAALIVGGASCTVIQEDAFSTDPVAPEFLSHADILMTENTMDEEVNFTWSAYRNLPEGLNYVLKATYLYDTKVLTTLPATCYKTSKTDFKQLVYTTFPNLPVNDTFVLSFVVSVLDSEGNEYSSNSMGVTIYAYGDAIAPVITLEEESVVLDPAKPMESLALISWEPARLTYGEKVSYNVYLATSPDAQPYKLAEGLTETSYSMTVDALNEAIIAAGGAENAAVNVNFLVEAVCNSLPEGITATSAPMEVTTYVATFPEVVYVPGSHQGWDPASAPTLKLSTTIKGYYEGIVDLTTADGSDANFKFTIGPEWGDAGKGENYGGVVEASTDAAGFYLGTVGASSDIHVASGVYVVQLYKKLNTIKLINIKSLGAIGEAFGGWDKEITMDWNKETNVFSVVADVVPGAFKFRLNDDWTFSIDNTYGVNGGGSDLTTQLSGNYKVTVDMSSHPYKVKFINTSFPEVLYVPGSHNDWKHAETTLQGDGEGHYEGYVKVGGEWGFKFTPIAGWEKGEWGLDKASTPETSEAGETTYALTASDAGNIMEGSSVTYARVKVDLTEMTVKVLPITSVEICGSFTGWGVKDEFKMSYSEATDSWKISGVEIQKGAEWKFRMNDDGNWTANLGYDSAAPSLDNLVQDGANIKDTEPGVYTIELFLGKTPYHATLTQTGDADAPALPETMYIIGNEFGSWNWSSESVVEMTPVNGMEGAFWAIRYMTTETEFKFSPDKDWGRDFCRLEKANEGFVTPDNNQVEAAGLYIICVDFKNEKVVVEPAKVFGFGPCFGGWDAPVAFNIGADGKASATLSADGELRMHTQASCYDVSWWQMEFVVLDGKIAYRGNGGDQERVNCATGQKVTLDFNAGTGTIE